MIPMRRSGEVPAALHFQAFCGLEVRTNVQTTAQLLSRGRGGAWRFVAVGCGRLLGPRLGSSVACGAELAERDHQGAWGGGERVEAEVLVERGGLLVDRVYDDGAHRDLGGGNLDA